jgi:hypothetical protein
MEVIPDANKELLIKAILGIGESLCCPICRGLFVSPVSLPCSHSFCALCFETHSHAKKDVTCPECRAAVNFTLDVKPAIKLGALTSKVSCTSLFYWLGECQSIRDAEDQDCLCK